MISALRPAPPDFDQRDGFEWRVAVDADWRIPLEAKRCRRIQGNPRRSCGQPAVAELNRASHGRARWWAYCAEHMYGRWIEAGQVVWWVLRKVAS